MEEELKTGKESKTGRRVAKVLTRVVCAIAALAVLSAAFLPGGDRKGGGTKQGDDHFL